MIDIDDFRFLYRLVKVPETTLTCYRTQPDGHLAQFLATQTAEWLARYAHVLAEGIDTVPVCGVNTHLLHLVKGNAALTPQFLTCCLSATPAGKHPLHGSAEIVILLSAHFAQAVCTPAGGLEHKVTLQFLTVAVVGQPVENRIESTVVLHTADAF